MIRYFLYWLAAANGIAFGLMVADKRRAAAGVRRIPESTLLLWAFLGGALGTVAASRLVRHKTRKQPFATWMMIWLWLDILLLALWTFGILEPWIASALAYLRAAT
ncbi:DUF1294 domain-containing protein [Sphingopyxis macrogoltabida]|uniref:DUF1294 domain-containing protein n=1 Tax=Sphingopyxis macrogoltabida TaxID=33050 RepID=UPI0006ED478B|nr:DUF1294 domain-containing protein [Sphingopyxis macrogoltabida]ALJ14413.1 putative inner membrane protein [Sphingopyxis macrogoltabida]